MYIHSKIIPLAGLQLELVPISTDISY